MNRRSLLLGGGLLVTIALTAWTLATDDNAEVVQASARPGARAGGATIKPAPATATVAGAASPPASASLDARSSAPEKIHNVFGEYSYQPAPRPVLAQAAPAPHAPPLPFVFSGRLMIPGRATIYLLTENNAPVEVHLGSDLAGFKLVEESPQQLVFLHAATGDRVSMSIASAAIN
jgi:hypothetical protein